MTALALHGHYGRPIAIDLCHGCNSVWFDEREDLHLAPGAVVQLFEAMGHAATLARTPMAARKTCPRCRTGLLRTHDRVHGTPFEYFRCTQGHGRFMGFGAFLRGRRFVRDLTADEVRTLSVEARVVKCVNCGASTDIRTHSVCEYCRAPIAVLDASQLATTLAELTAAEAARGQLDPTWPLRAEQARRQTEAAFADLRGHATPELDLVESGLALFARIAKGLLTPR
jgi:transposase